MDINKAIVTLLFFTATTVGICAEETDDSKRIELAMEYNGELQTDFNGSYNFLNHIRLDATLNVSRRLRLNVSTISMAKSNESILSDLQVFSNIESPEDIPLTLAVAGVEYELPAANSTHTFFAGIRNTGEDYFASDLTAFFINSSCGIYPTISANYPIGTFPYASMSLHYAYDSEHWGAKATIYNGEGHYRFSGRDNMFRICPQSDGIFCMAQAEYKASTGNYFLGGSIYKDSPTLWAYGEQNVYTTATHSLSMIAAYSHCLDSEALCRNFVGAGAKLDINDVQLGLFTDYADFDGMHEFATELCCQIPLSKSIFVKPALHYINGTTEHTVVGMMRFGITL